MNKKNILQKDYFPSHKAKATSSYSQDGVTPIEQNTFLDEEKITWKWKASYKFPMRKFTYGKNIQS